MKKALVLVVFLCLVLVSFVASGEIRRGEGATWVAKSPLKASKESVVVKCVKVYTPDQSCSFTYYSKGSKGIKVEILSDMEMYGSSIHWNKEGRYIVYLYSNNKTKPPPLYLAIFDTKTAKSVIIDSGEHHFFTWFEKDLKLLVKTKLYFLLSGTQLTYYKGDINQIAEADYETWWKGVKKITVDFSSEPIKVIKEESFDFYQKVPLPENCRGPHPEGICP